MKNQLNRKIPIGFLVQHSLFNFSRISKRIKINEGFRRRVYKDQLGNPSIGYGHLITPKEKNFFKKNIPKKRLLQIFNADLKKAILDFKKNYDYNNLSDSTQDVIIEMIFQLGIKKVLKFKKFYYFIKNKKLYLASLEMIKSKWHQQTPRRVNRLIAILGPMPDTLINNTNISFSFISLKPYNS